MSDLIEDQKIHYIVKDYRRMYNGYWTLRTIIEEQDKSLQEKDKEILLLRSKVNELKKELPAKTSSVGRLKGILNDIETMTNSMNNKLQQSVSQTQKISNSVEEIRKYINL